MKKSKRFLQKRILPFVTVFMLVLSALVVSAPRAEAVVYDYDDYIQSIQVDGDNDIVTVSLPVSNVLYWIVDQSNGWNVIYSSYGSMSYYATSWLRSHRIRIFPLGVYTQNGLSLSDIPYGTNCTLDLLISSDLASYDTGRLEFFYGYSKSLPSDSVSFSSVFANDSTNGVWPLADATFDFSLNFPADLLFATFYLDYLNLYPHSIPFTLNVQLTSFQLQMSISSLYRLQQEVGETNEILEAVKAELIDQGTTLDAVLTKLGVIDGKIDTGLSWLQSIYTTLQNIFSGIQSLVSSLGSSIGSGIQQITSGVASLVTGQQQTNSDLDEIINGGQIVDPGVSDAVDQFDDQISGVTDFENQVQNDFSQQFDAVLADFDGIGDLGPAFNFLGGYAGTLFVSLQDYSFIIILPIMIGVFMAICQHFPRGSLRGRSYSERVSFSQSELQSHRDAQSELASTRSWVDRDS